MFPTNTGVQIWHVTQGKVVDTIDLLTNQNVQDSLLLSISWSSDSQYVAASLAQRLYERSNTNDYDVSQENLMVI